MPTTWRVDRSESDRGEVTLDPWAVKFSRGYDPLHDYEKSWTVPHPQWLTSEVRALAVELLGPQVIAEVDAVVAAPRSEPSLERSRLDDAALADAWRRVPVVAGPSGAGSCVRAEFGTSFEVAGVAFRWDRPEGTRDASAHVGAFGAAQVRLVGLKEVAAFSEGFVMSFEGREPRLYSRSGARVDVPEQWASLGFTTPGFGVVHCSGVTVQEDAPWVRLTSHAHELGEALRVTGPSWWARLSAGEGVVARAPLSP